MTTYTTHGIATNNDVIFHTEVITEMHYNDCIEDAEIIEEIEEYVTFKGYDFIIVSEIHHPNGQIEIVAERFKAVGNRHSILHLVSVYDDDTKWDYKLEDRYIK